MMKKKIFGSIGFKIIFSYVLLSVINMSFIVSVIFENQVDLIAGNTKLEGEKQLIRIINSVKKFTYERKKGRMFSAINERQILDQIIKLIGVHSSEYMIISENNTILYKSAPRMELPVTFNEDGLRAMTITDFSGVDYYLRVDEEKKMIYCYIPLASFDLGNSILLIEKDIGGVNDSLKRLYYQAIYIIIIILLFHVVFAVILFKYIIHPVNLLNTGAKDFAEGKLDTRISLEDRNDEFGSLAKTFNKMAESVHKNIKTLSERMDEEKKVRVKTENLAIKDELTGLYNRTYILERLREELKTAGIRSQGIAFVIADIDNFNDINKIYGLQTGDVILRETAKTIGRNSGDTDIISRFGGEEFAVLSPGTTADMVQDMAERIRSAIEKSSIVTADGKFSVTVSIGISYMDAAGSGPSKTHLEFSALAGTALLIAKEKGRNRVEIIL